VSRRLKDGIIPAFCKYCEETEIPSLYALWCGLIGVSACLGRRCSTDFGYITIYPNLFVVLVAESGTCRKSAGIVEINRILRETKPVPNLLSQKMTPEALIDAMAGNKLDDDKVILTAEGTAIADELTTLIDRNSVKSGLTNLMTNLYDCGDFSYRTRGRGVEQVRNPCLSILGGTTIYWIKEAISASAITGGFTARIVFVYREGRDRDVDWPDLSAENLERRENIIHDLGVISRTMRGPFGIEPEAKELFKYEYKRFNKESELLSNPHTSGYAAKRHVTLLKTALCISASRSDEKLIDVGDIEVSIKALKAVEIDLPRVMRSITTTEIGDLCEFVINVVRQKKVITRSDLLKATRHKLTAGQLDDIMLGVCQQGIVEADVRDNRKLYIWKGN